MTFKNLMLGPALAVGTLCASAAGAVTIETTNFVASPTNFNGFEGSMGDLSAGVYTEDGIKVEYVGSAGITATIGAPEGNFSWYENGGGTGYTRITLADGGSFNAIQFLTGSGFGGGMLTLTFDVLSNGVSQLTGSAGPAPGYGGGAPSAFTYYGFSGSVFDEVRLQVRFDGATFNPTSYEAGIYDAIAIGTGGRSPSAAPEPASWALMIAGFGLAGASLRRRRSVFA